MTKGREPDSKAIAEARVELAGIVGELRATKRRALALVRQLENAASTAPALYVGTDGTRCTIEGTAADLIADTVNACLGRAIKDFTKEYWRSIAKDVARTERRDDQHYAQARALAEKIRTGLAAGNNVVDLQNRFRKNFGQPSWWMIHALAENLGMTLRELYVLRGDRPSRRFVWTPTDKLGIPLPSSTKRYLPEFADDDTEEEKELRESVLCRCGVPAEG
jgi:hypothetical protein